MASSTLPASPLSMQERTSEISLKRLFHAVLRPLASLQLTVILLALAIFLVLAGTLAQTQQDIWQVVHHIFRSYIAWIDVQVFFPKSFFPNMGPVTGTFPFPGGWLIGGLMAVNLFAAHAVRFTVQATGTRLQFGLGILILGMLVTAAVVAAGNTDGTTAWISWETLWLLCKVVLSALALLAAWAATRIDPAQSIERKTLIGTALVLSATAIALWVAGKSAQLSSPSMRILWQLMQGGFAGLVLLSGCWLLFRKRAGIVLLHGGIALMMLSELLVGTQAVETQMQISEGQASNYVLDARKVELAVIDHSSPDEPLVTAVPQWQLDQGARFLQHKFLPRWFIELLPVKFRPGLGCTGESPLVQDERLPFDVRIVRYLQNSQIVPTTAEDNPATAGLGKSIGVKELAQVPGTASNDADQAALYAEFLEKGSGKSLGVYLLSVAQSRWQEAREQAQLGSREMQTASGPFVVQLSEPVSVSVGSKTYQVALRHKRIYKPYTVQLKDVRFDKYVGTETAKNYSSEVRLVDPSRKVDREDKIWMNNPLRYAGETFYQQQVLTDPLTGAERTGLQIVSNSTWMIPYVSCMIVLVGMLFQFGLTLSRFIARREAGQLSEAVEIRTLAAFSNPPLGKGKVHVAAAHSPARGTTGWQTWLARLFPAAVVLLCAVMVARQAAPARLGLDDFDYVSAGKIPIAADGRVKPLDSLARNTLQVLSNKETFVGVMSAASLQAKWPGIEQRLKKMFPILAERDLAAFGTDPQKLPQLVGLISDMKIDRDAFGDTVYKLTSEPQPAVRWVLEIASGVPTALDHRIFRIENEEVQRLFGLKPREGFLYSGRELFTQHEKFDDAVKAAREKAAGEKSAGGKAVELTVGERKLLELNRRLQPFLALRAALSFRKTPEKITPAMRNFVEQNRDDLLQGVRAKNAELLSLGNPPLVVPLQTEGNATESFEWLTLDTARTLDFLIADVLEERKPNVAVSAWVELLRSYALQQPADFNGAVRTYRSELARLPVPELSLRKVDFEAFFNHFSPFFQAWILYIIGFVLSALAWLGWSRPLNRAAFWLMSATLLLHTAALIGRIYISGRPPVTNLYSSAVFIGWGCVVLGLILERVFRLGIGNLIASISGFAALLISFKLAGEGDTFAVLQAVLDTQFWLATHVTCITLGYATTFLAGMLGLIYVLQGVFTRRLRPALEKDLSRMIYGTLCFAIFFSFVGTVLGGLWADDSWGRFWGWDPKENGALIIVLWNALILHARWGNLVAQRGMAVLAVVGNIVTSWSWFGVNELGIGLHSYGFTEGVLQTLGLFVLSQMVMVGIGLLPRSWWRSFRQPVLIAGPE